MATFSIFKKILRNKKGICLVVYFSFLVNNAFGQFESYSSKQGLSQNTIYGILQDKKGFLWIATADGLNRFDGYEFSRLDEFATGEDIPFSIDGEILEDDNENIWIAGKSGLYFYDRLKNNVTCKNSFFKAPKPIFGAKIIGKNENTIWIIFDYNILVSYNVKTNKIENFDLHSRLLQNEGIISATVYNNHLIICTHFGIRTFKSSINELSQLKFKEKIRVNIALQHSPTQFYLGGDGLYLWDFSTNYLKPLRKNLPDSNCVYNDIIERNRHLFLATESEGLMLYDLKNEKVIKHYKHNKNNPASLNFDLVRKIYIDKTNQLWVGTDGGGLNKHNLNPKKFKLYRSDFNGCPVFSSDFIKCFYKDTSGKIWFGTHNFGLNVYDREKEKVKVFNSKNSKLPGDIIISIFKDSKQRIWVLTDMGICQTNENLTIFKKIKVENLHCTKGIILLHQIIELDDGTIVLSSENGLMTFEEKSQLFYNCSTGMTPITIIQDTKTTLLGTSYVGETRQFEIKRKGGKIEFNETKNILNNTKIRSYLKLGNSVFAASEKGLIEFKNNYKSIYYYGKKNGLSNLFLYGMLSDPEGNLWVSSNSGISQFDTSTHHFYNYSVEDNLQSSEFNTNAYYKSNDGEFYFGGIDGFNSFYPHRFYINKYKAPLRLLAIKLNGKSILVDSLLKSARINFEYTQNNIELTFALLDFTATTKVNYFYSVSDTGSKWLSLGNSRKISLSNLAPGHYTIWVKAINNDGVNIPKVKLLSFTIQTPYYKTLWFLAVLIILLLIITSLIIRYFSNQKLKLQLAENLKETEVLQLKQNISRDLHDHLGANLSRLSLLTQRLAKKGNHEVPSDILQTISTLTTEMNKEITELVWSVNTEYDNLESLLSYIRGYASTFLEEIDMPFSIQFDYPENHKRLNPLARQNLFSITKEALNNVAKYSKATLVTLTFKLTDNEQFIYTIQDNGLGFDLHKTNLFSNGLKNMKARCCDAGFDFQLETNLGEGVKIVLMGKI